jgi:hypothetical protein
MTATASNVIAFPPGKPAADADDTSPSAMVRTCRDRTVEHLGGATVRAFDGIVDELYALAEQSLEREARDYYLQAKEAWGALRPRIEARFRERLEEVFVQRASGVQEQPPEFSSVQTSWSDLSLVADGDLEESVRFTDIAGRIRNEADEELAALDKRMATLLERPDMASHDNPLAPMALCDAFRSALGLVESGPRFKLLLIRAFEDKVRPEVPALYKEINAYLKSHGILPVIRYGATKKPLTGTGPVDGPRGDTPQVIGSVTLPVVAGNAGLPVAGAPGIAMAASPLATAAGGPGTIVPGTVGTFTGAAQDPFTMLQQLLLGQTARGVAQGAPGPAATLPDGGIVGAGGGPGGVAGLGSPGGIVGAGVPGGIGGAAGPGGIAAAGGLGTMVGAGAAGAVADAGGVAGFAGVGTLGGTGRAGGMGGVAGPMGMQVASGAPATGAAVPGGVLAGLPGIPGTTGGLAVPGTASDGAAASGVPSPGGAAGGAAGFLPARDTEFPALEGVTSGGGVGAPGVGGGVAGFVGVLSRIQQRQYAGLPADVSAAIDVADDDPGVPEVAEAVDPDVAPGALDSPARATVGTRNVLHALKRTSLAAQMGQMDTVTLDIVAMLFDQIFGDASIPAAMKALIGRLQIPMLKVAVLDKTFFSKKTHPARRMLDTLGELSLGLGNGFEPDSSLHRRIDEVLRRVVEEFEEDFGVFERVTAELQALIEEANRTAERAAKQDAKRIQDKERLEVARLFAQNELRARLLGRRLPRAIVRFLATDWLKLLILAYAKGGRESRAWHSLVETMDILVWSLTPKQTAQERRRLVSLLPGLLKRLARGMDVIGTAQATRERFNGVLMRCHAKAIGGMDAASEDVEAPLAAERAVATRRATQPRAQGADERTRPGSGGPAMTEDAVQVPLPPTAPDVVIPAIVNDGKAPPPPSFHATADTQGAPAPATDPAPAVTDTDAPVLARASEAMEAEPPAVGHASEAAEVPLHGLALEVPDVTPSDAPSIDFEPARPPGALEQTWQPELGVAQVTEEPAPADEAGGPGAPAADRLQEELRPIEAPSSFPAVCVRNPFGEGEIEIEEVSFGDLPGFAAPMEAAGAGTTAASSGGDRYTEIARQLKEGDWVEFREDEKEPVQARLSYVSPYGSTYVFSNRKGVKVAEHSLYQLTRDLRAGRIVVLENVPLFDRAFTGLVGMLRKGTADAG